MHNYICLIINLACKYINVVISRTLSCNLLSYSQYFCQGIDINKNYTLLVIKSKSYDSTKYLRHNNLIAYLIGYCGYYGLHYYAKRD